jgi:hypothetical protein
VYAGGGSAQTNAAFWAATKFLNQIDSITDQASGADSPNYRILFGKTTKAIGTIGVGKNVLFFYKFNGGSFPNGGLPQVGAGVNLLYPTLTQVTGSTTATGAFPAPTFKLTGTPTDSKLPDWGISDEELSLFNTTDNLNGTPALASINSAQTGVYLNLFGVAVSNNVFATKKNFTKQEIAGILAGSISNWNQLFDDSGAQMAAGGIALLDRGSGSGSKAAGSAYFLNSPGPGAVHPNSVLNTAGAGGAVGTGINSGYTSTVLLAGTQYQDVREASSGAIVSDLALAQSRGQRAIAILGLEFPPAASGNVYSFAKINGVGVDLGTGTADNINTTHGGATKYSNAVTGAYDFLFQNSFNTRPGFIGGAGNNAKFAAEVLADLQKSAIAGANAGQAFPLAVPGVLLDPLTVGSQDPGVILGSRSGNSLAPQTPAFDAASLGGPITFGSDPL